jgi:hypothetical protein
MEFPSITLQFSEFEYQSIHYATGWMIWGSDPGTGNSSTPKKYSLLFNKHWDYYLGSTAARK